MSTPLTQAKPAAGRPHVDDRDSPLTTASISNYTRRAKVRIYRPFGLDVLIRTEVRLHLRKTRWTTLPHRHLRLPSEKAEYRHYELATLSVAGRSADRTISVESN